MKLLGNQNQYNDSDLLPLADKPQFIDRKKDPYTTDLDEYRNILARYMHANEVELYARHESEHMNVALAVGIHAVYAFHAEGNRFDAYISPYGAAMPRLAHAAVRVAPLDPSDRDMNDAAELGYSSIQDIGDRIVAWNKNSQGIHIPLPLTYTFSTH